MAVDNTPPRLKLIATIGVIAVVTLIAINFATESYFAMMTDSAQREKSAPTRDKEELLKAEAVAFTNASMPIDKAMAELGKGERPPLIAPTQSDDVGAMTGWSKLPKPLPTAAGHHGTSAPATGDGGAAGAGDAGAAVPTTAGDAGATHTAPGADGGAHH
jgi:hypothetical protein